MRCSAVRFRWNGIVFSLTSLLLFFQVSLAAENQTNLADASHDPSGSIVMVVMDPLALPLSCPCVKGYAQRNYDKLGEKLEKDLNRAVRVVYSESLKKAQETRTVVPTS